jgi:hypothetical protein
MTLVRRTCPRLTTQVGSSVGSSGVTKNNRGIVLGFELAAGSDS